MYHKILFSTLAMLVVLPVKAEKHTINPLMELSDDTVVEAVLTHHPAIKATASIHQASVHRAERADALPDPEFKYEFSPQTLDRSFSEIGQSASISQRIPWAGKRGSVQAQKFAMANVHKSHISATENDLVRDARFAMAEWEFIHRAIEINNDNINRWNEFLSIANTHYAAGKVSKQDVLTAEAEREMLSHHRIVFAREKEEIRIQLAQLMSLPVTTDLPPPTPVKTTAIRPLETLLAMATSQHPEIQMLRSSADFADANLKHAQLNTKPDFIFSTKYSRMWPDEDMRWSVGIGITIPFDQKTKKSLINAERAEKLAINYQLEDKKQTIAAHVATVYARWHENKHVIDLYKTRLLPIAAENYITAKDAYSSGRGDFLKLVAAEKQLALTELKLEEARKDLALAYTNLAHSVGSIDIKQKGSE